jgi:ubiquinone/menaquinone biosynthesis C-methylase UbiE
MVSDKPFDYEKKVWGAPKVRLAPTYIQALKLRYCLEDLEGMRGRVLDIGCGGGNMAKAMKHYRPDLEVWGTDVSTYAVHVARLDPEGVHFVAADGEHLPFKDGFFDAVTMFDILEHFPHPDQALLETRRLLRPGGLLHLFLPLEKQPYTIYALLHRLGWKAKTEHCGHIVFYSDRDCVEQLEDAGFHVKKTRWSIHPLYAMVDVAYFSLLSLRGKPVSTSVEGFVHSHNGTPSLAQRAVGGLKNVLVAMGYYESRALRRLPGGGGHFTGVKR